MTHLDSDCSPARFPCWEHYGDHHQSQRAVAWVLDLARAHLNFRLRALSLNQSPDNYTAVFYAANYLQGLHNAMWRDCVREPFPFDVGEGRSTEVPENERVVSQSMLISLGLAEPAKISIRRRPIT